MGNLGIDGSPFLNLVEKLFKICEEQRAEIRSLKNEINRLKGEHGTPDFSKSSKNKDVSSENERKDKGDKGDKKNKDNNKGSGSGGKKTSRRKKKDVTIHDTVVIPIDKTGLPDDIVPAGHEEKIIRGIKINEFNTMVKREKVYSPSLRKYFLAGLTDEYKSKFSVELQTFIIEMKHNYRMTEPIIFEFLKSYDIEISSGAISNILLKNGQRFIKERDDISKTGFSLSNFTQTDSTQSIEKGKTKQTHVFTSEYFSAFYTTDDRKRTTIIDILRGDSPRVFALNKEFFESISLKKIATKHISVLKKHKTNRLLSEEEITEILIPFKDNKNLYSMFYDFSYIAGFHSEEGYCSANVLLTDDASVYDNISFQHALCWIHEGRHFKKLNPLIPEFRDLLDKFITTFWDYYHVLLDYKLNPSEQYKKQLEKQFDKLFNTKTKYEDLNDRIQKLYAKKEQLLVVLNNPSIPLHNNASELIVRIIKRYGDISFQTMSKLGTEVRDAYYTVMETCKKVGMISRDYIMDRVSGKYSLKSLAESIENLAQPP